MSDILRTLRESKSPYLTTREAGVYLKIGVRSVRTLVRNGTLRAFKMPGIEGHAGRILIEKKSLIELFEQNTYEAYLDKSIAYLGDL